MYLARILLFFLCILTSHFIIGQVSINEFMSDNEMTIADAEGAFNDYIELFNHSSISVDLGDYFLSDDLENINKWQLPTIEIEAGGFILFFASGKDGLIGQEYHTNFKISSKGEDLILSRSGSIIDQIVEQKLEGDESFGRLPDGSTQLTLLPNPSPQMSNNGVDKVELSHVGGYYEGPIELSGQSLLGNEIRYTDDGSIPSGLSPLLPDNLRLENRVSEPNVISEIPTSPTQDLMANHAWQSPGFSIDKAHTLRFASFVNGERVSDIRTHTYFVDEEIFGKYGLPIISLVTDREHLFSDESGIYVPGNEYDPQDPEWTGNYFLSEIESERPVHIEYYQKDGDLGFAQDAGMRVHGGKTRHAAQKSIRMYARSDYDKKYFNYELLPQKEVDEYKRFILRTTMGAWGGETVIKDAFAQNVVRSLDFEMQDFRPVVVFINGEYWGIQTIRDRIDENFISYSSGISTDSIKIQEEWNHGYSGLKDYLDEHNPLDDSEYEYVTTQIDVSSFIDYNIAQMYLNNYDWPANNTQHWRPTTDGGLWRWIMYDMDAAFGDYDYNMLEHNTEDNPEQTWPTGPKFTYLFRSLIANDVFLERFLNRYKSLLENEFLPQNMLDRLWEVKDKYEVEMSRHIDRWKFPEDIDRWHDDIDSNIKSFILHRPCAVKEHIETFFDLDFDFDCNNPPNNTNPIPIEIPIIISPTLTTDIVEVQNPTDQPIFGNLSVYNSIGEVIISQNTMSILANDMQSVSMENEPSGMYFFRFDLAGTTKTVKVIVVH